MKRKQYNPPIYRICKKMRMNVGEEDIINEGEVDMISKLSDDLIHRIFSFLDTKIAIRTSILSKRWRFIWTTSPFLNFRCYEPSYVPRGAFFNFIDNAFFHRNYYSNIYKLELTLGDFDINSLNYVVKYAIDHNVQHLIVCLFECDLAIFKSHLLKKLELRVGSDEDKWGPNILSVSNCWDLPALTSLHLQNSDYQSCKLPISYLICLPALTNLYLRNFDIEAFSFPALKTLYLKHCKLCQTDWILPSLISLTLDSVEIPEYCKNVSELFSALVSLQYLTWSCGYKPLRDCSISCPQLVYLGINTTSTSNIVIIAPKLRDVSIVGIFSISCGVSALENVNIKFPGTFPDKTKRPWETIKKEHYSLYMCMFLGLGKAKVLTLDLDTIKALLVISDLLPLSPFCNLKYVKLPHGYEELGLPESVKNYLLGGSQGATIITEIPQNDVNPRIAPVPLTPQHINGKVTQSGGLVHGFGGPVKNISGAGNDSASSSKVNNDAGLWKGHEVNSEFVDLLDLILKKYPETFEHFTIKSKKLCTMKLNMLCTSINVFTSTTMNEIDTEMITEYRTLFADLQRSFNVKWLVSRLNYIEQLQLSQHDLPAVDFCIDEAFETKDAKLAASAGYIGDGLFSDL